MYTVDGAPPAARADPRPPARLRRLPAGADRQRRRRPAPDRRARRGDDRARRRPAGPDSAADDDAWRAAAGPGRRPRRRLGRSPTTALGDPRAAAALHPLPGDGVGRLRPRASAPSRSTTSRARSSAGARLRDDVRAEILEQGFDHERGTLHPALRHHRGRRLAAGAAAGRLRRRRRPADARHHRGGRAGPDARRACCCATAPQIGRRRRRRRRAPVPGLLVLAGLGVRRRRPARRRARAVRPAGGAGQRRRPARPRSTTPAPAGWPATSRRPSATSRWCRRRSASATSTADCTPGGRVPKCGRVPRRRMQPAHRETRAPAVSEIRSSADGLDHVGVLTALAPGRTPGR